jgi:Na+-transporting NADH:ubiquinone oxidoreductase subunit NqrB
MTILRDVRDYQILFLSLFLLLGISTRDWTLRPELILTVIVSCVLTQLFLSLWVNIWQNIPEYRTPIYDFKTRFSELITLLSLPSLRSALITGLGLSLLLRANDHRTMILAGCLAIASKFLFRVRGKHCFNPANFGIIIALLCTNDAWVSPGQWGTDWWYILLFVGTGGIILKKVGRWDTSATFFLAYTALEAIRTLWLGWSWDVLLHQLGSGSLLLFALFMLTDPRSIPNARLSRLIWAISIAILTFILQNFFYLPTAIFWALFILSPLTIILDFLFSAPRFIWQTTPINSINSPQLTVNS